jgi:hypothetical protein
MPRSALLLAAFLLALSAGPVQAQCPGDLNGDGMVAVDEIITIVNAALLGCPVSGAVPNCPGDLDGNGVLTLDEILRALNAALNGCPVPTATLVPSTPTATATETTAPTPSATPTAMPSTCPYTFLDNTLSSNVSCDYLGPFSADANCPTDLEALFAGDGSIVGVGIGTETLITFVATVTSATSASLFGYTIGSDTTLVDVTGTIELQQNGRVLVIAPDSPPFDIIGNDNQCAFVQYTGTYTGVLSGQAAPVAPRGRLVASLQPVSLRLP